MSVSRRILCLWLPRLGAERALRLPALRHLALADRPIPFALVEETASALRLASLNAAGEALGLRAGMSLADARAIHPPLATAPRDRGGEARFRAGLLRWAQRFSPWAAEDPLLPGDAPGEGGLSLDITGCAHLFGGEAEMAGRMMEELAHLGLTARTGIADTRGAAWALARYAAGDAFASAPGRDGDAIQADAPATRVRSPSRSGRAGPGRMEARNAGPAPLPAPAGPRRHPPQHASPVARAEAPDARRLAGKARNAASSARPCQPSGATASTKPGHVAEVSPPLSEPIARKTLDPARDAPRTAPGAPALRGGPAAAISDAQLPNETSAPSGAPASRTTPPPDDRGAPTLREDPAQTAAEAEVPNTAPTHVDPSDHHARPSPSPAAGGAPALRRGLAAAATPEARGQGALPAPTAGSPLMRGPNEAPALPSPAPSSPAAPGAPVLPAAPASPLRSGAAPAPASPPEQPSRPPSPPAAPPRAPRRPPPPAIAPSGGARRALAPLPVAALRAPEATAAALMRLGLRRIGDVAALPRAALARRFGADLVMRLDQALGAAPEPISPAAQRRPHAVRLTLPEPIGLRPDLEAGLARLLERLCARLETEGLGARRLRLAVRRVDGAAQAEEVGLARPGRDPARLAPLFAQALERIEAGFGIDALRLEAVAVEPLALRPHRGHLEAREAASARLTPGGGEAFDDLLGRLGARIGLERLLRPQPADTHIPEKTATLAGAAWAGPAGSWPPPPAPRPAILVAPEPLHVLTPGEAPARPPLRFRWRRATRVMAAAAGPERIAPEWWLDDPEWRGGPRDYWRVETEDGQRLWLFATRGEEAPRWFVQGMFG